MDRAWPIIFTMLLVIYPAWLGANHASFGRAALYAVVFAVCLFVFGPKSRDVQHGPGKPMLLLFSLIAAAGLTGLGYGLGYLVLG